jgi:hypothetical protein
VSTFAINKKESLYIVIIVVFPSTPSRRGVTTSNQNPPLAEEENPF